MQDLKSAAIDPSGNDPGDRLINNQTGNQRIHPDFAFLDTEKVAVIAGISRETGERLFKIVPLGIPGGSDGEGR